MLIASKYEEIWAPEIRDFVYISDKAYTREQIICMEKLMLNTLGFNLTLPTPYNFLARFLKAAGSHLDKQVCFIIFLFVITSLLFSCRVGRWMMMLGV
jgi:cyclin B